MNPGHSRRDFFRLAGAAALATSMPSLLRAAAADGRLRPNVLFISIDDLNDWIGCLHGHPDTRTPNMDRLAARGVLFANAHCPAPLCNASRAALMTGIRPSTSGVYGNHHPWRSSPALRNAVTLPQHFMAHGYTAIASGKIYHGGYPDPASWNDYWPSQTKNKPDDPKRAGTAPGGQGHFDWGPLDVPNREMGDWQVADWVTGQLQRRHDRPFFLGCGFFRPHLPWYVPKEYFDRFPLAKVTLPNVKEDDLDDVPEAGRKIARPEGDHARVIQNQAWRQAIQGYLASISFVDDCVGRVLDALDRSPHREDTIVVLWSDHGWHLGQKLHWRKFALWEEATHNVLTIAAPGVTRPGGRCDAPVNLLDLYPTLNDLCGLPPVPRLEGVSLLPLLKNPAAKWERPTLTTYLANNHSVRSRRWRYIRYADGSEELYDHSKDPLEWTNLARDAQLVSVKEDLRKHLPTTNAEPIPREKGKRKGED